MALVVCGALAACGDDGGGGGTDASTVPATLTISGTVTVKSATGSMKLAGVVIGAYDKADDTTAAVTTTSDAAGDYTLVVPTGGKPIDGYLKGTAATYMDTYLYAPDVITADFEGAMIAMVTPATFDLLANTLCGSGQTPAMGAIAVIVADAARVSVSGATVASAPAASKICYNSGGFPNRNAAATDSDGLAYMFGVTGQATVSAMKSGTSFRSHSLTARAGVFTTTLLQP